MRKSLFSNYIICNHSIPPLFLVFLTRSHDYTQFLYAMKIGFLSYMSLFNCSSFIKIKPDHYSNQSSPLISVRITFLHINLSNNIYSFLRLTSPTHFYHSSHLSPPFFFLRDELSTKITGEDRRELMELQYQVRSTILSFTFTFTFVLKTLSL